MSKRKPKPKQKDRVHYVNNAEFLKHMELHIKEVDKSKRNKTALPQVSDFIGECILSIANKLANKPNFVNYPFRDEMIADGIENCVVYLNNFNPKKSNNPFAYFTQIIYFAFIRRIQKEKKHLYTKYRLVEESLLHDLSENDFNTIQKYGSEMSDQNMRKFILNFEKGREEKKSKIKSKKKNKPTLDDFMEEIDES